MEDRLSMMDFARSLARRGLRDDALLILRMLSERDSVEVLDLEARILTQLGRYAEAEDAWQEVLAKSPEHQGATDGLATIANLRRSPLARLRVACVLRCGRMFAALLVVLVLGLALWGALSLRGRLEYLGSGQRALAERQKTDREEQDAILAQLRQDASDLANLQLRTTDAVNGVGKAVEKMNADLATQTKASSQAQKDVLARISQVTTTLKPEIDAVKAETVAMKKSQAGSDAATAKQLAALLKEQKADGQALKRLEEASGTSGEALAKSLADLRKQLDSTKAGLATLAESRTAQLTALEEARAQLSNQLDAVAKRVDALVAADPGKKISDLSAQYLQLRATLNAQKKQTEELAVQTKALADLLTAPSGAAAKQPAPAPSPAASAAGGK
jgi:tetratricopeptide (TPR) repeat protein